MLVITIVFRITTNNLYGKKNLFLNKILYSFYFHVVLKFYCYGRKSFKNNNDLEKCLCCG
jgi:hypothetical protein